MMRSRIYQPYHLFLLLAVFNLVVYRLTTGASALDIHGEVPNSGQGEFNYFMVISGTIILMWLSYYLFRKKELSVLFTWLHLAFVLVSILVLPVFTMQLGLSGMPRRYYDYGGFSFDKFFGIMTRPFYAVFTALLLSQLFLVVNLIKKPRYAENDNPDK